MTPTVTSTIRGNLLVAVAVRRAGVEGEGLADTLWMQPK